MQNVPESHLDKMSVFHVSCKNPCRDRVGPLPQNGHNRGEECWTPSRRIFESLSWVMDAGDPVDNCAGAQSSLGRRGGGLSLDAVCSHVFTNTF